MIRLCLRIFLLSGAIFLAAPCTQAQTFMADLNGASESPPNASPGTGFALVTLDSIGNTMDVSVTFSGLLAGNTAAHIHGNTAMPGVGTAGVATTVPTFTGFPTGVTSGTYDHTFDMTLASSYNPSFITSHGGTPASAEAALFTGIMDGTAYLNIHSRTFPGGEIRGFFRPTPSVPEPGTLSLLSGIGVCATVFALRRRRR